MTADAPNIEVAEAVEAPPWPPTSEEAAHVAANWFDEHKGMIVQHEFTGWGNRYKITRLLAGVQPPAQYPDTDLWLVIVHYESLAEEMDRSLRRRRETTIVTPVVNVNASPHGLRIDTPHFVEYVTPDVPDKPAEQDAAEEVTS